MVSSQKSVQAGRSGKLRPATLLKRDSNTGDFPRTLVNF